MGVTNEEVAVGGQPVVKGDGVDVDHDARRFHMSSHRLAESLELLRTGQPPGLSLNAAGELWRQMRKAGPVLRAGRTGPEWVKVPFGDMGSATAESWHEAAAALVVRAKSRVDAGRGVPYVPMGEATDLLMALDRERAIVPVP